MSSQSVPRKQKAILQTAVGKPLTLTSDHPVPSPGAKQVLLRVTVAGINPHDQKARDYGLFTKDNLPAINTNDVVGVVVKLGDGANKYSLGDHVLSHATFDGKYSQSGLQEYAVADEDFSCKVPDGITDDQAATFPTNAIAPVVGTFHGENGLGIPAPWTEEGKSFDYKGTTILVWGGGSNCGRYEVQVAALAKIGSIVVVGGDEKELKSYGATHVIDRHGGAEAVIKRVRDVVGDDLIYIFDAINPPDGQAIALSTLSSHKRGKLARLLPIGPVDDSKVIGEKKAGYDVINVFGSSQAKPHLCRPLWEKLPKWFKDGSIKPLGFTVVEGLDVDKVNATIDGYRDGKKVEKTHIHPSN